MTDKVQKIREEVEKIAKSINPYIPDEEGKNSEYEAGRFAMVIQIMQIIDSLQEEPVSDINFEQELYKAFGQVKDFTLGMRIAKWFYDMGKKNQEHVSEDLEEAMQHTAPDNIGIDDLLYWRNGFITGAKWQKTKDESTTEDLGEYINELSKQFPEVSFAKLSRIAVRVAKWHEEQFEENRLAHCDELTEEQAQMESDFVIQHLKENNRTPTFIDAIEYGIKLQKAKMAKVINVEVKVDAGGYPYIPQMELYDYDKDVPLAKEGDKYKVILIKED